MSPAATRALGSALRETAAADPQCEAQPPRAPREYSDKTPRARRRTLWSYRPAPAPNRAAPWRARPPAPTISEPRIATTSDPASSSPDRDPAQSQTLSEPDRA